MTLDERIERLVEADERLRELVAKQQTVLDKLTVIVFDITESVKRLERVSGVLLIKDEELDRRLAQLEEKGPRRTQ